MKFCKAWPDACHSRLHTPVDNIANNINVDDVASAPAGGLPAGGPPADAVVWPKNLVEKAVENAVDHSIETLLKESFGRSDSKEAETKTRRSKKKSLRERRLAMRMDPQNNSDESRPAQRPKTIERGTDMIEGPKAPVSVAPRRFAEYYHNDDMKPLWSAFAILAILFLIVVGSLMQRVRSLEASLHGRLMT